MTRLQSPSQDLLMLLLLQAVDVLVAGHTAVCIVAAAVAMILVHHITKFVER